MREQIIALAKRYDAKDAPVLIITDGACDRLNLMGRKHAYLIPHGAHLPFVPKGPVYRLK